MEILIIDNNIDKSSWGAEDLRRYAAMVPGAVVRVRRGPHEDLPRTACSFDKIVISGSRASALDRASWIEKLDSLVRDAIERGKHILGVCYGHQTICRILGGKEILRRAPAPEFGWVKIETTCESELFKGLPQQFHSFASHFEEVFRVPDNLKVLASSERCPIQACQLSGKPVFGIQFHPERNLKEGEESIAARRAQGQGKFLLNPKAGSRFYDSKVGELIFQNFFKYE